MRATTVRLQCDVCQVAERQGKPNESVTQLRDKLYPIGWRSAGARDVCENCYAKGHRP